MDGVSRRPTWPLTGMFASLLVLGLVAPLGWRTFLQPALTAPTQTGAPVGSPGGLDRQRPRAGRKPNDVDTRPQGLAPAEVAAVGRLSGTAMQPPVRGTRPLQPGDGDRDPVFARRELVVQPQPAVTDRIRLDPSVARTPALPAAVVPGGPIPTTQGPSLQPVDQTDALPRALEKQPPGLDCRLPAYWSSCLALHNHLKMLSRKPLYRDWATAVREALRTLAGTESLAGAEPSLERLRQLAGRPAELAASASSLNERADVLRAGYALERRLCVWEAVCGIASQSVDHLPNRELPNREPDDLAVELLALRNFLDSRPHAAQWREYLQLDQVRLVVQHGTASGETRARIARQVLARLHTPMLSPEQGMFLQAAPFQAFDRKLRYWTIEPFDFPGLLASLERYERDLSNPNAREIADLYQALRWSPNPGVAQLGEQVNTHYRNANVRVAITGELINRLLPDQDVAREAIDDVVRGARVQGQGDVSTRLNVVLMPDRRRLRLGLEARGDIVSETETTRGPATFYNHGRSWFLARKLLLIDRGGVHAMDAEATANSQSQLNGLATDFDPVPLLNVLARTVARQQYFSQAHEATGEMDQRVAYRARARLDDEVTQHINSSTSSLRDKFIQPLERLHLDPIAVDMETTSTRLIIRYRIAGLRQLGAHSPRPQAPGDSLLSTQIHETALNNIVEHLRLDGKRCTLRQLCEELTTTFDRPPLALSENVDDRVIIQLAEEGAIRVRCQNGRFEITIKLVELANGRQEWENFVVRAYYHPVVDGLEATLVREGPILLKGLKKRIRLRDQVALRGIFSAVLGRHPRMRLVSPQLVDHPELKDIQVTQLVVTDGWLGLAIGPQRQPVEHVADGFRRSVEFGPVRK